MMAIRIRRVVANLSRHVTCLEKRPRVVLVAGFPVVIYTGELVVGVLLTNTQSNKPCDIRPACSVPC